MKKKEKNNDEKLYEVIKTKNFENICDYINKNFKQLKSEYGDDAYAPYTSDVYELKEGLNIRITTSFDIFGANKTGGYYVEIENLSLVRFGSFEVFSRCITILGGKKVEDRIIICDYDDLLHIVNNFEPVIKLNSLLKIKIKRQL